MECVCECECGCEVWSWSFPFACPECGLRAVIPALMYGTKDVFAVVAKKSEDGSFVWEQASTTRVLRATRPRGPPRMSGVILCELGPWKAIR